MVNPTGAQPGRRVLVNPLLQQSPSRVHPAAARQLRMGAGFDDLAAFHDDNCSGIQNCPEAVRDDESGSIGDKRSSS